MKIGPLLLVCLAALSVPPAYGSPNNLSIAPTNPIAVFADESGNMSPDAPNAPTARHELTTPLTSVAIRHTSADAGFVRVIGTRSIGDRRQRSRSHFSNAVSHAIEDDLSSGPDD